MKERGRGSIKQTSLRSNNQILRSPIKQQERRGHPGRGNGVGEGDGSALLVLLGRLAPDSESETKARKHFAACGESGKR